MQWAGLSRASSQTRPCALPGVARGFVSSRFGSPSSCPAGSPPELSAPLQVGVRDYQALAPGARDVGSGSCGLGIVLSCFSTGLCRALLVGASPRAPGVPGQPEKGGASLQTQRAMPAPSAPASGTCAGGGAPCWRPASRSPSSHSARLCCLWERRGLFPRPGALNPGCALELAEELFKLPGTLASPRRQI